MSVDASQERGVQHEGADRPRLCARVHRIPKRGSRGRVAGLSRSSDLARARMTAAVRIQQKIRRRTIALVLSLCAFRGLAADDRELSGVIHFYVGTVLTTLMATEMGLWSITDLDTSRTWAYGLAGGGRDRCRACIRAVDDPWSRCAVGQRPLDRVWSGGRDRELRPRLDPCGRRSCRSQSEF